VREPGGGGGLPGAQGRRRLSAGPAPHHAHYVDKAKSPRTRTVFTAQLHRPGHPADDDANLFLDETPGWQDNYRPGKLRAERLELFTTMSVEP
jgi:hypothetical protein